MANGLERERLWLDAAKSDAELRIQLMQAYGEFNVKMMEALKLRVEIETDIVKLRHLEDKIEDFQRNRAELMRDRRRALADAEEIEENHEHLSAFPMASQTLPLLLVRAWSAFRFFLRRTDTMTLVDIASIPIPDGALSGQSFDRPKGRDGEIPDPPSRVDSPLELMDWARTKNIVPNPGSPAFLLLAKILDKLSVAAEKKAEETQSKLDKVKEELKQLRAASLDSINIDVSPKDNDD